MTDDRVLLLHFRDAARRILDYTATGRAVFFVEPMRQDAVVRNFEILREAAKNLSDGFRAAHADVPWREIARMRDRLIHHYFGVKLERVWQTAAADIPPLLARVESILILILRPITARWSFSRSAGPGAAIDDP